MLFILSKFLPALLSPLGFACLGGVGAALAAWAGRRRTAIGLSLAGAAYLYLAGLAPVSQALLRGLEGRFPPSETFPVSPAIVVLGGSGVPKIPPRLYAETNAFGDRLAYGALLFRKGLAPRLVTTGGIITLFTDVRQTIASIDASILRDYFGIDSSAILLAEGSRNTREDALAVRRVFEAAGLPKEIILVTSAAHMPRSVGLFRKQGFLVHPAPADFHASSRGRLKAINLLPDEMSLFDTCFALHEYLGWAIYKAMGWL